MGSPLRSTAPRVALLVALAGCGGGGASTSGGGAGGDGSGGQASTGTFTTGSGQPGDGCPDVAKEVYLLGKNKELVMFHPPTKSLELRGTISCSVVGGPNEGGIPHPFSMSVDRAGTAWILYSDGSLHALDLETMGCDSTEFMPKQLESFELFGMGFATDEPGTEKETLFLSSYTPGDGIGYLDFDAMAVRRVGFYNAPDGAAELTGTGKGDLWAFFLSNPVRVAQLDKNDADLLSEIELPSVSIGAAWAFAFWGGDFYLFTAPINAANSRIDRWKPGMPDVEPVLDDAGLVIVGAGVSTCAPTEAPK